MKCNHPEMQPGVKKIESPRNATTPEYVVNYTKIL
jgi:hypothetical protein